MSFLLKVIPCHDRWYIGCDFQSIPRSALVLARQVNPSSLLIFVLFGCVPSTPVCSLSFGFGLHFLWRCFFFYFLVVCCCYRSMQTFCSRFLERERELVREELKGRGRGPRVLVKLCLLCHICNIYCLLIIFQAGGHAKKKSSLVYVFSWHLRFLLDGRPSSDAILMEIRKGVGIDIDLTGPGVLGPKIP